MQLIAVKYFIEGLPLKLTMPIVSYLNTYTIFGALRSKELLKGYLVLKCGKERPQK